MLVLIKQQVFISKLKKNSAEKIWHTSFSAAGIFFCFRPDGILCNTVDKALVGDRWFSGDPFLEVYILSEIKVTVIVISDSEN